MNKEIIIKIKTDKNREEIENFLMCLDELTQEHLKAIPRTYLKELKQNKKPIKKWLCKNREYIKPYIKKVKFGLVSGVSCCPYCYKALSPIEENKLYCRNVFK